MFTLKIESFMKKYTLLILLVGMLSSCSLEKSVTVTTRGYEPYRQAGLSDIQIKSLQKSNAAYTDTLIIYNSRKRNK